MNNMRADHALPEEELQRIRSTRWDKSFQKNIKIASLMSCPSSACVERYRQDTERLQRQMPLIENDRLTLSGMLRQLRNIAYLDVFCDIHDDRIIFDQCFVKNEDDTYECVCCGFVTNNARHTDEESLSDSHAKLVPTCPLLYLTKGEDYIHNKLQETDREVYEITRNSTMEMESMMSVIGQLSRNGSGTLDEETASRVIDANVRVFFENGGLYANAEDITTILNS